ncbi:acyltransferase [Streptomyces sp. V4-01]|uniref:Acyltransferase n=1 Tax=Actinacidiphila polyblastidii TaxID=3110430 RepID=A0ABU7PDG9_9ACTN|nr:acyltransferase [Streptomyces sp. V4-01]
MPGNENVFFSTVARVTAWRRRAVSRLVHRGRRWVREAGAVTAARPGPFRFERIGAGSRLAFPQGTVFGEPWIRIGRDCMIGEQVTLSVGLVPADPADVDYGPEPVIRIGDGAVIGRDSHIVALAPIVIGDKVFCGPNVYVTSTNHAYHDTERAIGEQWPSAAPVEIGFGCWLGVNSVILPGARLGRNVVVAAGAVVRGEVPDHCVVAGAPARIVRRWDPVAGWQPPLRDPAPRPLPEGVTAEELLDLAALEQPAGA